MSKTALRALLIALALSLALSATGCAQTSARKPSPEPAAEAGNDAPLKIGYLPITHSAPLMLADAAGVEGIELVKFSSWPELTDALNAGRIDGAVTMLEIAFASSANGIPLKLVALSHRNGDVITVAKGIDSVADLKGQRVAIPHRLSGHNLLLKLALEREGLALDDVTRVEMAPNEMPAALARGDVKGYVVAEPFGTIGSAKAGGKAIVRSTELWEDWLCCGLVLRDTVVAERTDDVQAIVDAFVSTGAAIEADPSAASQTAAEYTQYDAKVWNTSLELGVEYSDLVPRADELDRLEKYLAEEGLLPGDVDTAALLDDSFVKKAVAD